MKALLMVEREGRVVCVVRRGNDIGGHLIAAIQRPTSYLNAMVSRADRWWLVESESADAARQIIAEFAARSYLGCAPSGPITTRLGPHLVTGRILASGGRP